MRWWAVLVAAILGFGFAILMRRNPVSQIKRELDSIDAEARAKHLVAEKGAEIARKQVETEHAIAIRKFDREQKERLAVLRRDPAALARWLTRISS